jgi:hypothetical protein
MFLLLSALLATGAVPSPQYGLLAHLSLGGYRLQLSDANGTASASALVASAGAVAARSLSPAFSLGALVELSDFLPDNSGAPATVGLLAGAAAVFRAGALVVSGGPALSVLGGGLGAGLGLLAAADVIITGPVSLHGQASWRNASGGVSLFAGELGLGLVY